MRWILLFKQVDQVEEHKDHVENMRGRGCGCAESGPGLSSEGRGQHVLGAVRSESGQEAPRVFIHVLSAMALHLETEPTA